MEGTVANFYCFLRSSDFQLKNCFASEGESLNIIEFVGTMYIKVKLHIFQLMISKRISSYMKSGHSKNFENNF